MRAAAQFDRIGARRRRGPSRATRTSSPYFSPNSAIAPAAIASSGVISRVVTASLLADLARSRRPRPRRSPRASIALGCEKSKRSRSARDQAALLRDMRRRAAGAAPRAADASRCDWRGSRRGARRSTVELHGVADRDLARLDRRVMRMQPAERLGRVRRPSRAGRSSSVIVPASPIWPPLSP